MTATSSSNSVLTSSWQRERPGGGLTVCHSRSSICLLAVHCSQPGADSRPACCTCSRYCAYLSSLQEVGEGRAGWRVPALCCRVAQRIAAWRAHLCMLTHASFVNRLLSTDASSCGPRLWCCDTAA